MNAGYSLFSLITGIFFGLLFSHSKKIQHIIPMILHYIIYVILFFLGVKLASSAHFLQNLTSLGKQAVIISICCIFGSCIAAFIVKKVFFNDTHK